ncbi:MAG: hypothetical protein M1818_000508 [Claussenomyces sp. TS43310]|nr:MAG: hypothetical protein M1818_000508 [Claussenomyces sp. TS43310]
MFAHFIQAFVHRKGFCWVIIMGAFWETTGFALRTYSTIDQTVSSTASAAQLLILLSPLWVNAFVYMTFGRMIWYYLPDQKLGGIQAQKMAKYFVWLDITAFTIQATGGIMDSDFSPEADKIGLHIYTAGIALQELFVLGFVGLLISFHRKMASGFGNVERGMGWRTLAWAMYATLALITVRIIYRLAEFANGGTSGPTILSTSEAFFYVFEALPMFSAILVCSIWHPGRFLVGPESYFPVKVSRKERKTAKRAQREEAKLAKKAKKARKAHKGVRPDSQEVPLTYV